MIDNLSDNQQLLIYELLSQFSANVDIDDIATAEDIKDIHQALEEYQHGEAVDFNDVDWD